MKKALIFTILALLIDLICSAQNLTLNDLQTIGNKSNWENVNQFVLNKGWEYYESAKGTTNKYNTITWSYKKGYEDKAEAWFYLYTYEESPNKVSYSVFNKTAYTKIQNSLNSLGYKLIDNEINDDEIISRYSNSKFIIVITTEKREREGAYSKSVTAYNFLLINKAGIYDPDNGKKVEHWEDGVIKTEYTLKNGEKEGDINYYHENGNLNIRGQYKNGKASGKFFQFDEIGNKKAEYNMLDGEFNGRVVIFEGDRISEEKVYENGYLNGNFTGYTFDANGILFMKTKGQYANDKQNGTWYTIEIKADSQDTVETRNYKDGLRHGEFEEYINSDSVEISNYFNGMREGTYELIRKHKSYEQGTDLAINLWFTVCEGYYSNDLKSGDWKYYFVGNIEKSGSYLNGKKNGKWTEYITIGTNSGQIFSEINYKDGIENGSYIFYYEGNVIKESVGEHISNTVYYERIFESYNFVDGNRVGDYVYKDSLDNIRVKGQYLNDLETGVWDVYDDNLNIYLKVKYLKGVEVEKSYFKSSELHKKEKFENGELKEIAYIENSKIIEKHIITPKRNRYDVNVIRYSSSDTVYSHSYKVNNDETYNYALFKNFGSLEGPCFVQVGDLIIVTGRYSSGMKTDQWIYRYPVQNAYSRKEYKSGKLVSEQYYNTIDEGLFKGELTISAANNSKEQIKIKNGLRHGKTRFYDAQNVETKVVKYKKGVVME